MPFHAAFSGETLFAAAFLLVFAVVFALLSYSGIFAKKDKDGNVTEKADRRILAVISLVLGLVSASYEPFLQFLQEGLPLITILLIALFFVVFIYKIFSGKKKEGKEGGTDVWPAVVALIMLLLAAIAMLGDINRALSKYLPSGVSPDSVVGLVAVLVIIAIFGLIYKISKK